MQGVTTTLLENGYLIHNETQISIEIEGMVYLYTVENTEQFVIDNNL
jgi:hypothetical protein